MLAALPNKIIVFDGVCVLCSGWVGFVLKRDRERTFTFAAMQSEAGRKFLTKHGIDADDPATFLVIESNKSYTDTDALIKVMSAFHFGWRLAALVIQCVPRPIRNVVYRWIARNRYQFSGKRDICYVPQPADAGRFLH